MRKLETKLINDTRKNLILYKQASNQVLYQICELHPSKEAGAVLEPNSDTKRTNIAGEPSFYVHTVDPNDSYSTFRVWCGQEALFAVTTDEMIDNDVITIRQEDNKFIKDCKPRNQKNEAASTPEGDTIASSPEGDVAAPTPEGDARKKQKEQTTSSPFGNLFKRMLNLFKTC